MFKTQRTILLLIFLVAPEFATAQTNGGLENQINAASTIKKAAGKKSERYPNELADWRFYETAKWKTLEPLVSTMADVRRGLGEPFEARDVAQYTKPYPGDEKAQKPVFTYKLNDDWQVLVYFVKYCFRGGSLPKEFENKLCSIELIPTKRLSFESFVFPDLFKKEEVRAAHAAWIEYSDGTGLTYEVYTTRTAYGDEMPGDLNRIVYSASDETFKKHSISNK